MNLVRTAWLLCAAATMAGAAFAAPTAVAGLRPYEASYNFIYRGFNAGTSSFTLRQEHSGEWTYVSRNQPRGIFRLVPKASVTLTSHMSIGQDGVRPQEFTATEAGASSPQGSLHFDWVANRVTGEADGAKIDMALRAGVQDDLSVQIALVHALIAGQSPTGIAVFDPAGIRDYAYTRVGEETLHTPLGDVPTIIYLSQRAHSPRSTRFWCAPLYGFVPMKAEQKKGDEIQWTMTLRSLHRD